VVRGSIVLVALLATVAAADDGKKLSPGAQIHLDSGLKLYGTKDYLKAAAEFEAGYAIDPEPSLLYAAAQALRLGGDCTRAMPLYKKYLETKLKPDQVTAANAGVELCEKKLASEPRPEPNPTPHPVVTPEPAPVTPTLDPVSPPRDPQAPRWYRDPIGGALVGGGAIGIVVGVVYTLKASSTKKDADAAMFRDDFQDLLDQTTSQRRIGGVALGVGAALVVGGVVRYTLHARSGKRVTVGANGSSLFLAGGF
jgi:hypothetical protein